MSCINILENKSCINILENKSLSETIFINEGLVRSHDNEGDIFKNYFESYLMSIEIIYMIPHIINKFYRDTYYYF